MNVDRLSDDLLEEFIEKRRKNGKGSSEKQVRSDVKNHLLNNYIINSKDIDYNAYIRMLEKAPPTPKSNCRTFIEYLYAYGYIRDSRFSAVWSENDIIEFKKNMENITQTKFIETTTEDKSATLNFEDLSKIQEFMELETNNKNYKAQFTVYMLLWLEFPVGELKDPKFKKRYKEGSFFETSMGNIEAPLRFREFIEIDTKAFSSMNYYLTKLGEDLVMSLPLTPNLLLQTRKKLMTTCLNCEEKFLLFNNRFLSVNNMIVCEKCAGKLKKKYKVNELETDTIVSSKKLLLKDYIMFEKLKNDLLKSPIDYLKLHEFQMEIGDLGEQYVYEYELNKLKDTDFVDKIDKSKAKDASNGYDILSYTENGEELYIEVKTTSTLKDEFYISQPELEVAEKVIQGGGLYKVYFVKDILGKPQLEIIDDILNEKEFVKKGHSWKMVKQ